MWMMGYNDGGDLYMSDSCNGRKLRPLIPRPNISSVTPNAGSTAGPGIAPPSTCLARLHHGAADVFSLAPNHIGMASEQSKRDFSSQNQVVVSSRWNPTPEQLRTLEELYRRGTRTPSAEQIQHITAQLRRYGKIEGKNVFYWFQNHKARERQKRRRQMESADNLNMNNAGTRETETPGRKETGVEEANKSVLDHRDHHQTDKNPNNNNLMNCSALSEENSASNVVKATKAGGGAHRKSSSIEWMAIDDGGDHHPTACRMRNAVGETWQMMQHHQLPSIPLPTNLINSPRMDPKLINSNKSFHNHHLTSFVIAHPPQSAPLYSITNSQGVLHISDAYDRTEEDDNDDYEGSQTLQLFPLRSGDGYTGEKEADLSVSTINSFVTHPHQFFEFLPLKNN